ncbi:hypothetical protein H5410_045660 [Solanum commersonii]|uniref:Uncharacterized protein n=1 Tax=Solanum commersonii TaxID=4109 RepID=A0A9J5XBT8_SOLCO|nr:hypothetical protein H5410_045660 [Solanum commersonii]
MSSYGIHMHSTKMAHPYTLDHFHVPLGFGYGHTCAMSGPDHCYRMHTPILKAWHSPRIMHIGTTVKHHPTNARLGQRLALLVEPLPSSRVISRSFGVSPSIAHSARSFPTRRTARSSV